MDLFYQLDKRILFLLIVSIILFYGMSKEIWSNDNEKEKEFFFCLTFISCWSKIQSTPFNLVSEACVTVKDTHKFRKGKGKRKGFNFKAFS